MFNQSNSGGNPRIQLVKVIFPFSRVYIIFTTIMCIQVFHNEITCSMRFGANPIGTVGVFSNTYLVMS